MGTTYYGYCDDCRVKIDLDRFYSWSAYSEDREVADIEKENLSEYANEGWIYRSIRLHWFIDKHNGHRQGVCTEHDFERDAYEETGKWPRSGATTGETIDWTDPKAGRLVIRSKYGDIYLDYLPAGPSQKATVNCFRFRRWGREDVVLLTESDAGSDPRSSVGSFSSEQPQ